MSYADGYPLLVLTDESLKDLNKRIKENGGQPVPLDRFRPNVVISGCATAYQEDEWRDIHIGNFRLRGTSKCVRCVITTTDQITGKREKEPLKSLATYRQSVVGVEFGRNFIVLQKGIVSKGNKVSL